PGRETKTPGCSSPARLRNRRQHRPPDSTSRLLPPLDNGQYVRTPSFERALHVGLTVRDMHVSAEWYERVLGFEFVKEFEVPPGEAGMPRILMLHPAGGFLVGLCCPRDRSGDEFTPLRTGLDHVAFEVRDAEDLDRWIDHLDSLGVAHSP